MADYQKKYVESIKVYHRLHAELSSLTVEVTNKIARLGIARIQKDALWKAVEEAAERIQKVDDDFRKLVRKDWKPPTKRC